MSCISLHCLIMCDTNDKIRKQWILRNMNTLAVELSRIMTLWVADIYFFFNVFIGCLIRWGWINYKHQKYNSKQKVSRFWTPGTSGVDACTKLGGRKLLGCSASSFNLLSNCAYENYLLFFVMAWNAKSNNFHNLFYRFHSLLNIKIQNGFLRLVQILQTDLIVTCGLLK